MVREAVLGTMRKRVKTDMRLPEELHTALERVAAAAGIPMNAIIAVACAQLCAQVGALVAPGKKRAQFLDELEGLVQKVMSSARNLC